MLSQSWQPALQERLNAYFTTIKKLSSANMYLVSPAALLHFSPLRTRTVEWSSLLVGALCHCVERELNIDSLFPVGRELSTAKHRVSSE